MKHAIGNVRQHPASEPFEGPKPRSMKITPGSRRNRSSRRALGDVIVAAFISTGFVAAAADPLFVTVAYLATALSIGVLWCTPVRPTGYSGTYEYGLTGPMLSAHTLPAMHPNGDVTALCCVRYIALDEIIRATPQSYDESEAMLEIGTSRGSHMIVPAETLRPGAPLAHAWSRYAPIPLPAVDPAGG